MIERFRVGWVIMRRVGFNMELYMRIIAKVVLMRMMSMLYIMMDLVFVMIEDNLNGSMMRGLVVQLQSTMEPLL